MANNYYNHGSFPATASFGSSAQMRSELDSIAAGFDKLPTLTGNAFRLAFVNAAGTALTTSSTLTTDTTGNLGVGVSAPTSNGPTYRNLELRGTSGGGGLIYTGDSAARFLMGYGGAAGGGVLEMLNTEPLLVRMNGAEAARVTSAGNVGIATSSPTAKLDVNSNTLRLRSSRTPSSASDTGNAGDICWDSNYVYVCVSTNTWKRSSLSTW